MGLCPLAQISSWILSGFLSHVWVFVAVSVLGLCQVSQILSRFQLSQFQVGHVVGTLWPGFELASSLGFCPGSDLILSQFVWCLRLRPRY